MRDILNTPISELFKKNTSTNAQKTEGDSVSLQSSILHRPISEFFKKTSEEKTSNIEQASIKEKSVPTHVLNTPISELFKKNLSTEKIEGKQESQNIFQRPISELFKGDTAADNHNAAQETDLSPLKHLEQIIAKLDDQYQEILVSFTRIHHFISKHDLNAITLHLEKFREQFKQYLVSEHGALHHYLQNIQTNSDEETQIMSVYRLETHRFTNTILRFLRKWTEQKFINEQNINVFDQDYTQTHEVLTDRMHHENSIFNMLNQLPQT